MASAAPAYRWRCHKCDAINAVGQSICAACHFPAIASAADVSRGQVAQRRYEQMKIDGVSLPIRIVIVTGLSVAVIGVFIIKFAISIPMFIFGAAVTALGAVLGWVGDRLDSLRHKTRL